MVKNLDDKSFSSFVSGSFYSAVGFYHPAAPNKDELFKVMEDFSEGYGNVGAATMDITGQEVPGEFGITEEESPIIVVFKQGNPVKAVNVFSVESVASAIAPPGKNITLQ
jgi:thioredoxin-like negative regulator of GroEL